MPVSGLPLRRPGIARTASLKSPRLIPYRRNPRGSEGIASKKMLLHGSLAQSSEHYLDQGNYPQLHILVVGGVLGKYI
jgi:hypothetical protein